MSVSTRELIKELMHAHSGDTTELALRLEGLEDRLANRIKAIEASCSQGGGATSDAAGDVASYAASGGAGNTSSSGARSGAGVSASGSGAPLPSLLQASAPSASSQPAARAAAPIAPSSVSLAVNTVTTDAGTQTLPSPDSRQVSPPLPGFVPPPVTNAVGSPLTRGSSAVSDPRSDPRSGTGKAALARAQSFKDAVPSPSAVVEAAYAAGVSAHESGSSGSYAPRANDPESSLLRI